MYSEISRIDKSLRIYQQEAKDAIFSAWDEYDNIMFQMPTGTGKTRLFTSIISDIKTWSILCQRDITILIIAHRVELIEQISESLTKYRVTHGIIAGGKERNLSPQVQVASIQTITHRKNLEVANALNADFIIIDEAHHSTANSYKKLWEQYPNAKKLGVTATPWRMNHMGFKSIYEKLIISKPIKEFIKEGWLAPYNYYSIPHDCTIRQGINSIVDFDIEGDYKISVLESVMDKQSIRANLLKSYLERAKGKKGIIYSISRRHSEHICSQFKQAGINIVRIDSETPKEERRLYVQRFKEGLIDIIVNVDIFSEGFDCPDIEFIQLARPTKSLVKYLQQVGRGLRPVEGKTNCIILDNVGAHIEFELPDSDREWESEFEGLPKVRKKRNTTTGNTAFEYNNQIFEEGTDDLTLIESADTYIEAIGAVRKHIWTTSDDKLLEALFRDRHCTVTIISSVFNLDETIINERLTELGLIQS